MAGDELVSLNNVDVTTMSRTEAWSLMKRLEPGQVVLNIRRSLKEWISPKMFLKEAKKEK